MQNVEINHIYDKGKADEWESCVRVVDYPERGQLDLVNPNEMVTGLEKLVIEFDYPLSNPTALEFTSRGGFSRLNLFRCIYEGYKRIYDVEDGDPGNIPGMLNHATSDGPFGIWGHSMGDLFIEGVEINDDGTVKLHMGS